MEFQTLFMVFIIIGLVLGVSFGFFLEYRGYHTEAMDVFKAVGAAFFTIVAFIGLALVINWLHGND